MAYAAVVSLRQTIHRLLNLSCVSILPCSLEILNSAYKEVRYILRLFKELDERSGLVDKNGLDDEPKEFTKMRNYDIFRDKRSRRRGFRGYGQRMKSLDGKVREAAFKLEDALETHFVNLIIHEGPHPSSLISLDLEELIKQDINSFIKTLKELEAYMKELCNPILPQEEEDDDDDVVSSRIDFGVNKSKMVGFSDEFRQIKDLLHGDDESVNFVSLVGMAGLGKTTLAKELFEDSSILEWFDHRVWVTVGPEYQFKGIVQSILSQVNPNIGELIVQGDELDKQFRESLKGRRCLIVVDDVWDIEITRHMKHLIMLANGRSRGKLGSLILLTTRLEEVGANAPRQRWPEIQMLKLRFLTKEESWDLLRDKLFGEESCPPQLEKAGKKIAENCDSLPLTIVTVAELLSKAGEMTVEYWNKVAKKENSIFIDAYDQMSKVILRSYNYLPQYLKACFLYMGIFPQKYDIPFSKLTMLWIAEECFLPESKYFIKLQGFLLQHLDELVGKSLVLVRQRSYNHKPKTYGLHSALWHSCMREAQRNKFFHVLNNYADSLITESIRNQRRLCIHNNILFGLKDVHKSMESISSTVRSLLCTGPHHQYPVPVCFGLRLLRVIHALTIRFYEFPLMELMKLVLLRYLALTYDGKLPPSISKLWNLQFLIVRRHLSIINLYEDELYLPMEIWDMKELKHLQFMGGSLPDPCDGALLPNLLTLVDVSARSCTQGVLKGLPKLEKLGIRIELAPDATEALCCFDHISHLNKLESLKCVVVNPELRSKVIAPLSCSPRFPERLGKLSLSGLGYQWEDMKVIASLPNLRVLKLRCYAFQGPKWDTHEMGFPLLEFLLIEDTDLVNWTVGRGSFSKLQCLNLKQCYKLQEIPRKFRGSLTSIEIFDCNPLIVICAKEMQKNRSNLEVNVHSSWDDGKLKA